MVRLAAFAALFAGAMAQETITITIVASNQGGGAQTMQMNPPMTQPGMTHQVTVGGAAGLVYTPDSINAAVGDMVQFNFMTANHTATQSTFDKPCVKMQGGIDTGFMPNPNNTINPPPMMMVQVMTKDPIWMYCRQKTPTGHCGKGMTFSINPTAAKSQAAFKAAAIAQNGTAGAGGAGAAPPPAAAPPPPAAAPPAASPPSSGSGGAGSIVPGMGSTENGQCTCSCLCGTSAFPNAMQGMGAMGGLSGAIPAAAVGTMMKRSIPLIS